MPPIQHRDDFGPHALKYEAPWRFIALMARVTLDLDGQ
jgi:hypothetical protein